MHAILVQPNIGLASSNRRAAAIAESLGLDFQRKRHAATDSVEAAFTPLSADELLVLRAFAPTAYRQDPPRDGNLVTAAGRWIVDRPLPFSQYRYDVIPAEVLEHWESIRTRYAFDLYEIRTTERLPYYDPFLIGYFGASAYLLARWGLESPGSLPFPEIVRRVKADREATLNDPRASLWRRVFSDPRDDRANCPVWTAADRLVRSGRY